MNILLTGGTGFIGQRLMGHLRSHHQITVLSRTPNKVYQRLGHDIKALSSLDQLDNLDQFDAVINLAGEPIADKRWTQAQKERICQSRWNITQQLVDKLKAGVNPPRVLISGSAVGFYGRQGDALVDEDSNPNAEFSHHVCAQWERLAQAAESEHTRVCRIRLAVVLGAEGGALKKMLPGYRLGLGGPIGTGKQYMSWIHIEDVVNLILFLLEHEECSGPFNAAAPEPVTNEQFSRTLARVLGKPHFARVPAWAMKLLLGEMASLLLTGQRVMPVRLQQAGFHFRYPTLDKALKETLCAPQSR
ncbi:TIGR01777 family oxidoreductase [Oceanisphaera arctica]|uniref:TIGR01777 family protein n=1 Tax=Oceanisphaera arctica TaxID=641510 RepID=A0A2P5TMK3_9GAMM|nr:TIGR01777 family oxidoreductase [Oceanisphaera arctica]PPL16686.1 TIGR01777 family protein [Oceanisphaera arctica]GHA20835.1 epimerase [Oceanisphaera arctica]